MAIWIPIIAVALAVVPIPTLGFELPKFLAAAVLGFAISLVVTLKRKDTAAVCTTLPGLCLLSFAGIIIVSLLWSVAPIMSIVGAPPRFQGIAFRLTCIAVALCVAVYNRQLIEKGILLSNILVVCYGTMQMLQADPLVHLWKSDAFLGRTFSTLGHPNSLGQFIVLTIPFVWDRIGTAKTLMAKRIWIAISIINVVVLLGTVSRSAIIALVIVALLYAPLALRKTYTATQWSVGIVVTVLCGTIAMLSFAERFSRAPVEARSASARTVMWESAIDMIAHRPMGYGVEVLSIVTPQFIPKDIYIYESLSTVVDRMHSEPLELLVTLGPLGLIAFYGLVISLLVLLWPQREEYRPIIASIIGYNVALLFGFASIATAVFFWMVIGLALGIVTTKRATPQRYLSLCNGVLLCISCITLVIAVQWTRARVLHAVADRRGGIERLAYDQEGIMTFRFDRQELLETTERHIQHYAKDPTEEMVSSITALLEMYQTLTAHRDGMYFVLHGWFLAEQGETEDTLQTLHRAEEFFTANITYHRTMHHIAGVLNDPSKKEEHKEAIRALLPQAVWDDASETRRILLKQHRWLKEFL